MRSRLPWDCDIWSVDRDSKQTESESFPIKPVFKKKLLLLKSGEYILVLHVCLKDIGHVSVGRTSEWKETYYWRSWPSWLQRNSGVEPHYGDCLSWMRGFVVFLLPSTKYLEDILMYAQPLSSTPLQFAIHYPGIRSYIKYLMLLNTWKASLIYPRTTQ